MYNFFKTFCSNAHVFVTPFSTSTPIKNVSSTDTVCILITSKTFPQISTNYVCKQSIGDTESLANNDPSNRNLIGKNCINWARSLLVAANALVSRIEEDVPREQQRWVRRRFRLPAAIAAATTTAGTTRATTPGTGLRALFQADDTRSHGHPVPLVSRFGFAGLVRYEAHKRGKSVFHRDS